MTRASGTVLVAALLSALLSAPAQPSDAQPKEPFSLRWAPRAPALPSGEAAPSAPMVGGSFSHDPQEPSVGRAVLYSLLLPGLGDRHLGRRTRANVFFGIEAAIWTGFVVSRVQGAQREESYEEYAVRFAGVSRTGHSDDYYALVREYDSSLEYEAALKAEGRAELWPDFDPSGQDPDVGSNVLEKYYVENRVSDFEPWEWRSLENKVQYQEIRSASKNAYRRAKFALAAAAANRVVSAIFAYSSTRRGSSGESADARRYQIDFNPPRPGYEAAVTLTRRF